MPDVETGVIDETTRTTSRRDERFGSLYRDELGPQVRRAYLLLGDAELANDIVHDAMTQLYVRWEQVAEPGAYLNRAVLNGCRDAGRRRATATRLAHRLRPTDDGSEVPGDLLSDALAELPFPQRAAVVLRFYADLTNHQIAEALDCAPGSVGPWIDRGLRALRKVL